MKKVEIAKKMRKDPLKDSLNAYLEEHKNDTFKDDKGRKNKN